MLKKGGALYFPGPVGFPILSRSFWYRGSDLDVARSGEYITKKEIIAWASSALFMQSK